MNKLRSIWRHFQDGWQIAKPFWIYSRYKLSAFFLLLLVGLSLASIEVLSYFAKWNGEFYNSLQEYNFKLFIHLLYTFGWILLVYLVIALVMALARKYIELTWRTYLTEYYQQMWLHQHNHYKFTILPNQTIDNPDQRISDDINGFIILSLDFVLGLIRSVFMLIVFIPMLWKLSGIYNFNLWGHNYHITGFMLYILVLYVGIATIIQIWLGRPLIKLSYNQQAYEADFRYSLIRLRENSENISLYHGENKENQHLKNKMSKIISNNYAMLYRQIKLDIFGFSYGQINSIFPILVMAPQYFAKKITLGTMMQTQYAFSRVLDSLSFVINIYSGTLVGLRVIMDRLLEFQQMVDSANDLELNDRLNRIEIEDRIPLVINNLQIFTPHYDLLLEVAKLEVRAGKHVLISGQSGSGKTTLFKVLSAMWPYANGDIITSSSIGYFFVSQRSYLAIDSIYNILTYPHLKCDYDENKIKQLLTEFNLAKLIDKLHIVNNYMIELSLGEIQRLMIIRVIIYAPDVVFLDEATSAMDYPAKHIAYHALYQYLPSCTIVSISHDTDIAQYHTDFYKIEKGRLYGT